MEYLNEVEAIIREKIADLKQQEKMLRASLTALTAESEDPPAPVAVLSPRRGGRKSAAKGRRKQVVAA